MNSHRSRIAVVGAGMAGLACARGLARDGLDVAVFDKSRGLGGRLATRRTGALAFDHGAQYVTTRSDAFRQVMAELVAAGAAGAWHPAGADTRGEPWYVGAPGMSALARPLADGLPVAHERRAVGLHRAAGGWQVRFADGEQAGAFDAVVLAVPAPQAADLLGDRAGHFPELAGVSMAPCWAAMAAFDTPLAVPFDVVKPDDDVVAWMARNNSKPGRPDGADQWVIHATAPWSRAHLESAPDAVADTLVRHLARLCDQPDRWPALSIGHRWRYAFVDRPLGRDCLWRPDLALGLAGDWCLGARVEAAFTSGAALGALVGQAMRPRP